ncbi:MAG: hypothetical protein KatS3mg102_2887 [Planctomycetota bacterium]|nr:MAG: hypothetical protein KatS3mg102_2887 [Planctomycetota bacterium]
MRGVTLGLALLASLLVAAGCSSSAPASEGPG